MSASTDSPNVLLSYVLEDAEWAEGWLLSRLEKQGVNVFVINRDLLAGGTRLEQLAEQALSAQHTLIVLSPSWVASQSESFIGLVSHSTDPLGRLRKTIPLLRKTCDPPRSLARLVHADFTSQAPIEWEREFARLLGVLHGQQYRTALGPPLGALLGLEAPTNFIYPKNRHFVGRDQELAEIHELLDDATPLGVNAARQDVRATSRVAGLTGLGGVGKTQLVVEYIYRYRNAYPGGVFWVNAADGVEDGFAEIGRVISGNGHDKTDIELLKIANDYLRSDPDTLLVLDNLNDLALLNQPAGGILSPISLPCRMLYTTRRRDLRGMRSIAVDMLAEKDALELLLRSRPEIMESVHLEHALAVKICATLGGLPLAIEMSAAYLEQKPDVALEGYLNRLGKYGSLSTIDSLEQAQEWSPTWHDPVQMTLRSQWDALIDGDARLLLQAASLMPEAEAIPIARLSLLTGLSEIAEEGFPSPLASAIQNLHYYSMIEALEKGKQLRLHPLVREFVRTQITAPEEFSLQCATNMAMVLQDMLRVDKAIRERGVDALLADLHAGVSLSKGPTYLEDLRIVLDKEAHNLRKLFCQAFPGYILQQVRARVVNLQKTTLVKRTEAALSVLKVPWLRSRFPTSRDSQALLRTLEGHTSIVEGVAITPDGTRAISASWDRTLRLWDLESGQSLHTFEGHTHNISSVVITPDGTRAISASADETLRLWDLESGQSLHTFEGHTSAVEDVVIAPDGKRAISASHDKTLRLWDLESGQSLYTFEGHTSIVKGVALTPDGKRAISASGDGTLRLWDLDSGQSLHTFEGHTHRVLCVAITPDGKRAISASFDKTLRLWDLESGQSLQIFVGHTVAVECVAITPDGKRAISASHDKTLRLWDLENGQSPRILEGPTSNVFGLAFTSDGTRALFACQDSTLRLWDLESSQSLRTFEGHTAAVGGMAITPDGTRAISASWDSTLRLWDPVSGQSLHTFVGHTSAVQGVAITPDGTRAISASHDKTLRLWDLLSGQSLRTFLGHTNRVQGVAITPDGTRALSASSDKTMRLWDLESGQSLRTFEVHTANVYSVAITPDSKHAFSTTTDNALRLWDLESGQSLRIFEKVHTSTIEGVVITPDGKHAISASDDKTLCLWDLESGRSLHTFVGHTKDVYGVAITPDGKRVISASWDNTIRLWNLESGKTLLVFVGEPANYIAIDKTGLLIVVGDTHGAVHFIDCIDGNGKG